MKKKTDPKNLPVNFETHSDDKKSSIEKKLRKFPTIAVAPESQEDPWSATHQIFFLKKISEKKA